MKEENMNRSLSSGGYYFTEEHEWIRVEENVAFVGLTTLAKRELGQIQSIEIHTLGKDLMENQVFGRIRTKRYLYKLIMPVRG
jgi:glycine cleavage system H protein